MTVARQAENALEQDTVLSVAFCGRMIHFTDFVREGDRVEVYRSSEDAVEDRGPFTPCTVHRRGSHWWLVEVPS